MLLPLRKWFLLLLLLMVQACAPTAQLEMARQALAQRDLEGAHRYYTEALNQQAGNEEALQGIRTVRTEIARRALEQAAAAAGGAGEGSIPKLQTAVAKLDAAKPYDPEGNLLGPARDGYQKRMAAIKRENQARAGQVPSALAAGRFEGEKGTQTFF